MGSDKLIVNTLNGPIKGKNYITVFGKEILAFHRIPYIKTPIGNLRFKDPQPVDNWNEVLDCSLPPIPSLNVNQMLVKCERIIEGDETAIHINAYTKDLTSEKLRPVMVWIHGGGFVSDSSITRLYSPDYLLERDVVLFTFNYRLGVLGFLSLDDPKLGVPGNAGLKDQSMAMRWIKNNCDRFGGDPNNITLFGESAGGASVHFHALSEMSRGLFHKAILMSGTVLAPWATVTKDNYGLQIAKSLGWKENEPVERALEILQNANGMDLLNAQSGLLTHEIRMQIFEPFLPIVEPYVSDQCFIPKPVAEMMVNPWSKNIPFIISSTSDEGLCAEIVGIISASETYDNLGEFESFVPKDLVPNNNDRRKIIGSKMKQQYYGDQTPSRTNRQGVVDLMSDLWFLRSIHKELQSRTSNPSTPTYLLRFAFDSKRFNHFKIGALKLLDMPGASHADDLSYLFKNDYYEITGGLPSDSKEFKTMKRMVELFTNFAATSNPNGSGLGDLTWEPLKSNNLPYECLNISDDLAIIGWPESDRMKFWDQLYAEDLN